MSSPEEVYLIQPISEVTQTVLEVAVADRSHDSDASGRCSRVVGVGDSALVNTGVVRAGVLNN